MKRFICRSLLFLLPVFAVLAGWEIWMRNFPHVFRYKKTVIVEKCRKDGEIVFLGNSHAFFGVNTDVIPHAYNLAFAAQKLHQDLYIFKYLVSKPTHLKCVAVPISVFSLFSFKSDFEDWRERDYVRYWGYPANKFADHFYILDNVPLQLVYVRKTRKKISSKGICGALGMTPTGWGISYKNAMDFDKFETLGATAALRHCSVDMNDTREFDALKSLIRLAQQHGIKVILFTSPAHKSYYTKLNPLQLKKMHSLIAGLTTEKGVYYLDLLQSDAFEKEDFYDPDHMVHKGAKKLALILFEFYKKTVLQ